MPYQELILLNHKYEVHRFGGQKQAIRNRRLQLSIALLAR